MTNQQDVTNRDVFPDEVRDFQNKLIATLTVPGMNPAIYPAYLNPPGASDPINVFLFGPTRRNKQGNFDAQPIALVWTHELERLLDHEPATRDDGWPYEGVRMSPDLHAKLKERAEREDCSLAHLLRKAAQSYLESPDV